MAPNVREEAAADLQAENLAAEPESTTEHLKSAFREKEQLALKSQVAPATTERKLFLCSFFQFIKWV